MFCEKSLDRYGYDSIVKRELAKLTVPRSKFENLNGCSNRRFSFL